jgi:hypothetical protein
MNDFEELMHSYGLDASNPDHMDELLFRITNENISSADNFDDIESMLSQYSDLNEYYDEYSDDDDELIESQDC